MVQKIKMILLRLLSYIKPIDLGLHTSDQNVLEDKAISAEDLLATIEYVAITEAETNSTAKSFSISLNEEINVELNPKLGKFAVVSMYIVSKSGSSMIKLRNINTGKVIKISLNTFRALF